MGKKDYQALTIIKAAVLARSTSCIIPGSKLTEQILNLLLTSKKIYSYHKKEVLGSCDYWQISLKYDSNLVSYLKNFRIISTPTKRIYVTKKELYQYYNLTQTIVSTPYGVVLALEAIRLNSGGEVFFTF